MSNELGSTLSSSTSMKLEPKEACGICGHFPAVKSSPNPVYGDFFLPCPGGEPRDPCWNCLRFAPFCNQRHILQLLARQGKPGSSHTAMQDLYPSRLGQVGQLTGLELSTNMLLLSLMTSLQPPAATRRCRCALQIAASDT